MLRSLALKINKPEMGSFEAYAQAAWAFGLFVPFFCILFLVGIIKAILTGPLVLAVVFVGNAALVVGLWPAFVFWTFRSVIETNRFGLSLKFLSILFLPVLLVAWPAFVMCGSVLVGLGYGFFSPMVATFEAVGEERGTNSCHIITSGTWGTLKGSCTIVRDFFDWCYHSYPAYLDDFRQGNPENGKPYVIKFLQVPQCAVVGILGLLLDGPVISLIAVLKSPIMLVKGWQKLLNDFVARNGACTKAVCVPFTGLSVVLWPLVVVSGLASVVLASFLLGLYGAVVVYEESSFKCGLAYIVAIIAEFDEYSNDVLYLCEGSCLPRPRYRKHIAKFETSSSVKRGSAQATSLKLGSASGRNKFTPGDEGNARRQLTSSKSVKQTIQQIQMVQIWENLFKGLQLNGKFLLRVGVIKAADLEDYLHSTKNEKSRLVELGLPAYTLLKDLLISAKSASYGLILQDGQEVTSLNRPQDRLMDWFFDPLVVLKEQLKAAHLKASEENYLEKLVLTSGHPEQLDFWQNGSMEPENDLKKGELQAIARRVQGIITTGSRFPTYHRRFQQFVKSMLTSAQNPGVNNSNEHVSLMSNTTGDMSETLVPEKIFHQPGDDLI